MVKTQKGATDPKAVGPSSLRGQHSYSYQVAYPTCRTLLSGRNQLQRAVGRDRFPIKGIGHEDDRVVNIRGYFAYGIDHLVSVDRKSTRLNSSHLGIGLIWYTQPDQQIDQRNA